MSLAQFIERQPREAQRLFAITLLTCMLGSIVLFAVRVVPWSMHVQSRWRAQVSTQLAAARGWIDNADAVKRRERVAESAAIWRQFYVAHDGMSVKDAIQRDVTSLFNAAGGTGLNVEGFDEVGKEGVESHGVRATASLTADQLRTLFEQMRGHAPYLRMQRIQVTAPQIESHYQNPVLLVVVDVVGYSLKAEPPLIGNES